MMNFSGVQSTSNSSSKVIVGSTRSLKIWIAKSISESLGRCQETLRRYVSCLVLASKTKYLLRYPLVCTTSPNTGGDFCETLQKGIVSTCKNVRMILYLHYSTHLDSRIYFQEDIRVSMSTGRWRPVFRSMRNLA